MITYFYWTCVILAIAGFVYLVGFKLKNWKVSVIGVLVIGLFGVGAYYFYFEQIFVKRWGGAMSIKIPEGHYHIGATWKYDNLWIENYDPANNRCYLQEHSRAGVLEGKVIFENCNPYPYQGSGGTE